MRKIFQSVQRGQPRCLSYDVNTLLTEVLIDVLSVFCLVSCTHNFVHNMARAIVPVIEKDYHHNYAVDKIEKQDL